MWFADVGLLLAGALLGLWVLAVVVFAAGRPRALQHLLRVRPLVGAGSAALLFAASASVVDAVEDRSAIAGWDGPVLGWFLGHRAGAATVVMMTVSGAGGTGGMAVLALVGTALLVWRKRYVAATVVVVATAGAAALNSGFKRLYGRMRPPVTDQLTVQETYALPSGHALWSVVVLGVLAAVGVLLLRHRAWRIVVVGVVTVAVLAIGVSRLYLGVHWLTDVLAGWLLGGAWLALCVTALVTLPQRLLGGGDPARAQPGEAQGVRHDVETDRKDLRTDIRSRQGEG